ncbi:replication-relaxation family protein [Aneurinibacillus tyrosinisolvens]|uniref:replication-relaxation family protein n=1 Tax=Aneurinibacillus tyrosinisolvens TaxID=1443435 RepID=UPI00063F66B4|nr:replication-relaxation family protein [Aneurinibacillus tyrosinisolvens]
MIDVNGIRISKRFVPILELLYLHRVATAEQLLTAIFPAEYPPNFIKSLKSRERPQRLNHLFSVLRMMKKEGLLQVDPVEFQGRFLKMYSLTKDGTELSKYMLKIDPDLKADGYENKYGDFPYDLQRPPKGRIQHHLLLIEFFLQLNFIRVNHPTFSIQYRDNRFATRRYTLTQKGEIVDDEKNYVFRPDAEFRMTVEQANEEGIPEPILKSYYVEIDRGTEYFEELKSKFEGYARYFDYLEKQVGEEVIKKLPEAILFVTDERDHESPIKRRWKTISAAFTSAMAKWATKVNLIYAPLNHVERVILQEKHNHERIGMFAKKIQPYLQYQSLNTFKKENGIDWGTNALFTVAQQSNQESVLFLFERSNGCETRGILRFYDFIKKYESIQAKYAKSFAHIKTIRPVFITFDNNYLPVPLESLADNESAEKLINQGYVLNIKDDPHWSLVSGEQIKLSNPLIYK